MDTIRYRFISSPSILLPLIPNLSDYPKTPSVIVTVVVTLGVIVVVIPIGSVEVNGIDPHY